MNDSVRTNEKTINDTIKNLLFTIRKGEVSGVVIALILLALSLTFTTETFLTGRNLFNVTRAFSFIAMAALGELAVIISGGIDLSVGSVMGLSGVMSAYMLDLGMPVVIALIVGLSVGFITGTINATLIAEVKLPPVIATIGMLSIARGFAYAQTKGTPIVLSSKTFIFLGRGEVFFIPTAVLILIIISVIFHFFLKNTTTGNYIFALGGNEQATAFSGINTKKMKYIVYILSGIFSSIGGVLLTARLGTAQSTQATGYELDIIASTVIGGASLSGGEGTVLGAVLGAAIMGILRNGLVLWNVYPYWQQIVIGLVIILAVSVDVLRRR
jgi:ribose transport system permease protein